MAKQKQQQLTEQAAPQLAAPAGAPKAVKNPGLESRLKPSGMHHIFVLDILGDGRLREVAVVKMVKDHTGAIQTIYYIDVALLDNVDKGRIKAIVTSTHADKYEMWDLLSQNTLNNGKNALDYFHQLARSVNGPGAINTNLGGGLANIRTEGNALVGAEFSPDGRLDTASIDS